MTKKFKSLTILMHSDGSVTAGGGLLRFSLSESELNDLADDIRSAQCWLRDVRLRQAENDTPELPMQ